MRNSEVKWEFSESPSEVSMWGAILFDISMVPNLKHATDDGS